MGIIPSGIIPFGNICNDMNESPFKYGVTVSNKSFTNRELELEKLISNVTSGINTIIISPRRWGKTSLVEKAISQIKNQHKEFICVEIDLFVAGSIHEFIEIFARDVIKASSSKWEDWIHAAKDFFQNIIPTIQVGIDPTSDFSISFDKHDLPKYYDEILQLPQIIAQKKRVSYIICIDEFQNLATFDGYEQFEKKMRAVWQKQKNVTYCLYGSKRHMMSEIFTNSSKPFYKFGDFILLQKIKTQKWIDFIVNSFAQTGKSISVEQAQYIADVMKNHSWYVQQLSHYTWNKVEKITETNDITTALQELIQANTPLYQREVEILSSTQLQLLKAIASNETQFTSTVVMNTYSIGTPNNVLKNKQILLKNDIVYEDNGRLYFLDPAFEIWFNSLFIK